MYVRYLAKGENTFAMGMRNSDSKKYDRIMDRRIHLELHQMISVDQSPSTLVVVMMTKLLLLLLAPALLVSAGPQIVRPWGLQRNFVPYDALASVASLRGGAASDEYVQALDTLKAQVLAASSGDIEELRSAIVDGGKIVDDFGSKTASICNKAMDDFASSAPKAGEDASKAAAFERKLQEVEAAIDAPLQVLYMKQLSYLRDSALQSYRSATKTSGATEYEAMLQADSQFVAKAQDATREGSDWDYTAERSFLQEVMKNIADSGRKANEVQLSSAQQQQTAMQFLQSQQQMIQQLQMQLYGQSSPWNVGVAYRIPDTNINLQGTYQQGRANVQLSCVPDEYAAFLGPNGFTNGVGPGNLGLSLNLSI